MSNETAAMVEKIEESFMEGLAFGFPAASYTTDVLSDNDDIPEVLRRTLESAYGLYAKDMYEFSLSLGKVVDPSEDPFKALMLVVAVENLMKEVKSTIGVALNTLYQYMQHPELMPKPEDIPGIVEYINDTFGGK